jgi:alpha-tubulin suppressor-like RCC1 family protein
MDGLLNGHWLRCWTGVIAVLLAGCGAGGDGVTQLTPLQRQLYLAPSSVSTSLGVDRVAQGYDSGCMLTPSGDAWCWGNNEHGQLGAVTAKSCQGGLVACSWQAVQAQAPMRFASLSPSRLHSCGIDLAGQAWCWGFGAGGQLGDGLGTDSMAPVAVAGQHHFVHIDAGSDGLLSCALDDVGTAWCWGPGDSGGLGNGTSDGAKAPVRVLAAQPFTSVGAGSNHGCGLDANLPPWASLGRPMSNNCRPIRPSRSPVLAHRSALCWTCKSASTVFSARLKQTDCA